MGGGTPVPPAALCAGRISLVHMVSLRLQPERRYERLGEAVQGAAQAGAAAFQTRAPPSRYALVSDCLAVRSCLGVPSNITLPPLLPPSGPMSMIQSAFLIIARLCS